MRYGYVTGFATAIKDRVDLALLEDIKSVGFDFVEFPLVLLDKLSSDEFEKLLRQLESMDLAADASCNMFPAHLRLTGPDRDFPAVELYLKGALERLHRLGTKKIIFGSSGARNLPEGTNTEMGYEQISDLVKTIVLPLLVQYDLTLCMEPIGHYEANFINTLDEGMRIVQAVSHPRVRLLADSVHMLYEHEDISHLQMYSKQLEHIHITENDRILPKEPVTPQLDAILRMIKKINYNKTLSFEPMPHSREEMAAALAIVKGYLD